jgi:hydrogenase maturation protease
MSDVVATGNTVILGVGNLLMRDEGVGVHAANQLERLSLPRGVEVREGGTDGFKLINIVMKAGRLILVDAVKGGGEPATLYRFDMNDCKEVPDQYKTSVHQIGIYDVVTLSGLVGEIPRTTIIGVEPAEIAMSMELSDTVRDKLPRICELALEAAGVDPAPYRGELAVFHPPQLNPLPGSY